MDPIWVQKSVVLAIHDEQLAEHGGLPGLRDEGALDSALARPQNLAAYGNPSIVELAAAYAFGLARNHAFTDGNKRVSVVVTELFLEVNGYALVSEDAEVVEVWLGLAAGDIAEEQLTKRLERHVEEVS